MKHRPITVAPEAGRALASLDGATMTTTELLHDSLLPDAEVRWDTDTTITIPSCMRALTCPECWAAHLADHPDALTLGHVAGCVVGEEEADLARSDLRRLAKGRAGKFHRPLAEVEHDLLAQVGLSPRSHHTGVWSAGRGRRRRTFAELSRHEPALLTTTGEDVA